MSAHPSALPIPRGQPKTAVPPARSPGASSRAGAVPGDEGREWPTEAGIVVRRDSSRRRSDSGAGAPRAAVTPAAAENLALIRRARAMADGRHSNPVRPSVLEILRAAGMLAFFELLRLYGISRSQRADRGWSRE